MASLVPLMTAEHWPAALSGLTLKNVTLTAYRDGRKVFSQMGELLLTHFGVSGPLVRSSYRAEQALNGNNVGLPDHAAVSRRD